MSSIIDDIIFGRTAANKCANCGKGDDTNLPIKCCQDGICAVKYCSTDCKIAPPAEDCPICFLPLPTLHKGSTYQSCCGKRICNGCNHAPVYDNQGNEVDNQKCPYCRAPWPSSEKEAVERLNQLVKKDDPLAIYGMGCYYRDGRNYTKAFELFARAGELGHALSHNNIGYAYQHGEGVAVDKKKAEHYYELAAIGGNVEARYNLGNNEVRAGNMDKALKHHMIATAGGYADSLEMIKEIYSKGYATKEDYTKALRSYHLGEIKSPQRDKAAAEDEENRYY